MKKCDFCGEEFRAGKKYVMKDAKIYNFCSGKCEKNMIKLGRKPREAEWTEEAKEAKKMRLAAKKKSKKENKE